MTVVVQDADFTLHHGDCLEVLRSLPERSVHCCVTSPPYWGLRDYGHDGQIGLESSPEAYVARMVDVFREVRRVLRDDGTLWLNLGDSYASAPKGNPGALSSGLTNMGRNTAAANEHRSTRSTIVGDLKPKDLVGVPWKVAFALQADGWWLRSDIIWSKPNPMPESVTDRPTKSHEYVFLLSKSASYFFDQEAVREEWQTKWMPGAKTNETQHYGAGNGGNTGLTAHRQPFMDALRAKRHDRGQDTLDGSDGESPRGPDGRRKTVHDHSTDLSHGNHAQMGDGRDRWPNGGRNVRSVWEIATQPYAEAHFATFPQELPRRCIAAGSPAGGTVLDPFMGSGTTALVARNLGRRSVGIELNADYCELAARRLGQQSLLAGDAA